MNKAWFASLAIITIVSASRPALAQEMPAEYQQVLSTLGKQGDFKDQVLKVNIPRNDVQVLMGDWGTGPTEKLASAFKAAVAELGKK